MKKPTKDYLNTLAEAFKTAQRFQEGAKQLQKELEAMEITGNSEGELVKVVIDGNQKPLHVEITPAAIAAGVDLLPNLVTVAMKDAYNKSTAIMRERMTELTRGLKLPPDLFSPEDDLLSPGL